MKQRKIFEKTGMGLLALFALSVSLQAESVDRALKYRMQDSEEIVSTGKIRNDNVLNLGHWRGKENIVGMYFRKIPVPKGSTITNAYLSLTAKNNGTGDADFLIYAEANAHPHALQRKIEDLSSRLLTQSEYQWDNVSDWEKGSQYQTGNLNALLQEVIDTDGWKKGGSIALIVKAADNCKDTGCERDAVSSSRKYQAPPVLHIDYRPKPDAPSKKPLVETEPENWYIRLVAEDPDRGFRSGSAQLGQLTEENAAQKHALKSFGTFGKGYLDIIFKNPEGVESGEYKSSFHPYQDGEDRWQFSVNSDDTDATILLSWRGLYVTKPYTDTEGRKRYHESRSLANPLNKRMKLIDSASGEEIPAMIDNEIQIYTFTMDGVQERNFEWIIEEKQETEQQVSSTETETESTVAAAPMRMRMMAAPMKSMRSTNIEQSRLSTLQAKALRKDAAMKRVERMEERAKHFDLSKPPVGKRFGIGMNGFGSEK